MRIAFIAHLSEISGAGTALLDVASAFRAIGHDVYLILPGPGDLARRAASRGVDPVIIENAEVAVIDAAPAQKLRLAKSRADYVARLRKFLSTRAIDVAYVNSSASIFAGVAARLARVPIVWHIHETLDLPDRRTSLKKMIIRRLAARLVYASRSAMAAFPAREIPAMIARNAIDVTAMTAVKGERENAASIDPATRALHPSLLLNGTIRRKGADVLLHAVSILRRQQPAFSPSVTITGAPTTDPPFYADLQKTAAAPELAGTVTFAGIQDSLAPYLRQADIYISASRNEAMPIAIVEAMAAGVPVIATNVGDCADLLDHGQCGVVIQPENPQALAAAIWQTLQNPADTATRTTAAAQKIQNLYATPDFWQPLITFVENTQHRPRP